jgi:hypothetical protein
LTEPIIAAGCFVAAWKACRRGERTQSKTLAPSAKRQHNGISISVQRSGNPSGNHFGGLPQRIIVEMRISCGGCRLSMT